jgi:hypothetical protein
METLPEQNAPLENPEQITVITKPNRGRRRKGFGALLSKGRLTLFWILVTLLAFTVGSIGGYQLGIHQMQATTSASAGSTDYTQMQALAAQVNPSKGYSIPAKFGSIGPKLLAAGAIDYKQFEQVYAQSGKPLTDEQKTVLNQGTDQDIVINSQNAYFLLNFFWALGLTNQNSILTSGPMMAKGKEGVGGFASTGGWTIGAKKPEELYASTSMISLTAAQQNLLDQVASAVYRPCCDNPTHFPDCNHGMAMLGLLELMASQNATEEQMFQAAKYVNAFWYPQQYLEIATLFQADQKVDFDHANPIQVVSQKYSSGSGFQSVHQSLISKNLLQQAPSQGGSCGV